MHRFVPLFLAATVAPVAGCSGATYRWQPSLVSQVPDSTTVRFAPVPVSRETRDRPIEGRALDWRSDAPKLITARGDTVVIPRGATMSVRLKQKAGHAVAGAILGAVVGVVIELANCPGDWGICGEENPTELLMAGVGALIGNAIKTDHWVRVRWEPPSR